MLAYPKHPQSQCALAARVCAAEQKSGRPGQEKLAECEGQYDKRSLICSTTIRKTLQAHCLPAQAP